MEAGTRSAQKSFGAAASGGGQGFVFVLSCNPTKTKNTFRADLLVKLFTLKGLHLVEVKPPPTERPRPTL